MSFFTNKMDWKSHKKYTPLLLLLSLGVSGFWWGKYPSKQQAMDACREWENKGNKISYKGKNFLSASGFADYDATARQCRVENETKQILGYESNSIQNGTWKSGDSMNHKIVKHFRY